MCRHRIGDQAKRRDVQLVGQAHLALLACRTDARRGQALEHEQVRELTRVGTDPGAGGEHTERPLKRRARVSRVATGSLEPGPDQRDRAVGIASLLAGRVTADSVSSTAFW